MKYDSLNYSSANINWVVSTLIHSYLEGWSWCYTIILLLISIIFKLLKEYKEILIDTTCKYSDIKFIWEGIEQSEQTQDFQKQNQFKLVDTCARDKVFTILFSISWKKQKLLKLFERRRKHAMFGSSASGSKSDCTAHALYGLLFVKQNQMFNSKTRFFVVWF